MKKIIFFLTLIYFPFINAQTTDAKLSLSFENLGLYDIILQLEEETDYRFFLNKAWLEDKTYTRNYQEVKLTSILDDLFKQSNINYFVRGEQVILTQGSIIYDSLPKGFLKEEKINSTVQDDSSYVDPIFYVKSQDKVEAEQTLLIGKENKNSDQVNYQITGKIVTKSGEPISGLNILVPDQNTGTVTDINGNYSINLPKGVNFIEMQSLGIEKIKKRLVVYSDGVLDFELEQSFEELDEILIEANAKENVESVLTGVEKIDVSEIKTIPLVLGERDILKVATTLPGISTAGEAASGYNVRGGKTDQNLILLDEGVIYNPTHFFGIFSGLNPFTTESVSIYKGSIPAEYGGRLSSVFDLTTKNASKQDFKGEVSIGPVTGNVSLEIPIVQDKSSLIIGGRATYSDWILSNLDEESLRNSQASFYDFVAKYNHKFDNKDELSVSGYYSDDKFSITSDSLFNYNNRMFSVKYNKTFNEKHRGEIVASNSNYNFNIDFESDFDNNFESGYTINETELKLRMNYIYNKSHTFNYGVSSKYYIISPGDVKPSDQESIIEPFSIPKERALETAIYFEDSYEITDRLLINAGLRYSFYAALGSANVNLYEEGLPRN